MREYEAGYQGHDSMREKARRAFADEMRGLHEKPDMDTIPRKTHGNYRKGGHAKAHRMSKEQTDLYIPRKVKKTENMNMGGHSEAYKKGGKTGRHHKTHYSFGGLLGKLGGLFGGLFGDKGRSVGTQVGETLGGLNDEIADNASRVLPFLKKGGKVTKRNRRECEEHEEREERRMKKGSGKKHHYASGGTVYEREMVGAHPSHKAPHFNYESLMRGAHPIKKAAGGVAKIRHKEATKKGMPIKSRKSHRYDEGGEVGSINPLNKRAVAAGFLARKQKPVRMKGAAFNDIE